MPLTHADIERMFVLGRYAELIRATRFNPTTAAGFEAPTRVMLTQTLAFTGDFEQAKRLASLDAEHPNLKVRSQAHSTLGIVHDASNDLPGARHHHQAAVRFAQEANDSEQLAWAQLYFFRSLIESQPAAVVLAQLPLVRAAVTRAGNPQASAYLHVSVAAFEGQTGRLDEGLRHCDVAESLLSLAPNARIEGGLAINRACIAFQTCEFVDALRHLKKAAVCVEESGSARATWALQNNSGVVETLTGRWEQARIHFGKLVADNKVSQYARLAASDGIAKLSLALNQLENCEQALTYVEKEVARHPELSAGFQVRWASVTKARFLLREGRLLELFRLLGNHEDAAVWGPDTPFHGVLHLITAQAHARQRDLPKAAVRLMAADEAGATRFRELQPQYFYACAQVLRQMASPLEEALRSRANRLWASQGVVSPRLEMEYEEAPAQPAAVREAAVASYGNDAALVADSLASAMLVAHSPSLLGAELLSTIASLGCSPHAKLVSINRNGTEPVASEAEAVLKLGTSNGKRVSLVCPIPPRPDKAVLLADVLRIGRAAIDLERLRQEERNRAAVWPADPVETEAGALFLAEEMQELLATARRIAPTTVPVLITGETGTGKEVLARLLHAYSQRAKANFLPFNCSSTPKEMLDSQLFGHRRGSFTGATDNFSGVIRAAANGTLFLDEIGETTLDVQPKLLRFLESSEVHPIGETAPVRVDVRVIAATNADLESLVSVGRFREDLFYRLNIVRLHVPPLRERRVEIPSLANHYLQKYAREWAKGDLRLAEETMEYLVLFRWPGNVRQLANEMRRLAALAEPGAVLMPEHLSPDIAASRRTVPASQRVLEPTEVVVRLDQPMPAGIQHLERTMILYALDKCGGRMEETAAMLGLSRKGLYLKRLRYGLEPPAERVPATDVA
jgi:DNA-binding NtrC family response regulator/tetratricopeptide (TPR) repeat protein